jgi:hypothetical protein
MDPILHLTMDLMDLKAEPAKDPRVDTITMTTIAIVVCPQTLRRATAQCSRTTSGWTTRRRLSLESRLSRGHPRVDRCHPNRYHATIHRQATTIHRRAASMRRGQTTDRHHRKERRVNG